MMDVNMLKNRMAESAARVLGHPRAQEILADERVQRAVTTAFEVGQQARQELRQVREQVEQLIDARQTGPASDDTRDLKDELDAGGDNRAE